MGVDLALCPSAHDRIGGWWSDARKRMPKLHQKEFDSVVTSICWNLWKQRNGRVFGHMDLRNEGGTVDLVWQELEMWTRAGATGVARFCE